MTISLTINGDNAASVIAELAVFLQSKPSPANLTAAVAAPAAAVSTEIADGAIPVSGPKTRKKAPAVDAVIDQPKNDALMLTIDDARERMRKFNSDGHMDQSAAALAEVGAKKLSEVDPEAGGNPSPKYHALVTRIEALIAEKG